MQTTFKQCEATLQQKIIDTVTEREYNNDSYDCDLYNKGIFMNAVDKMGFIRPVKAWGSSEIDYKEEERALHYNLSYSQGEYAFIVGEYNLNKLIEALGNSELASDLRFIHKKAYSGAWEIDFQTNKDGFIIERKEAGRFEEDTNILDFISELETFQEKRKIKSKIIDRVIEALSQRSGGSRFNGSTQTSKNIVEQAFYDFEYNLKKELYADIEAQEEQEKEYWQEEVLKPQLENAIIDGDRVIYNVEWEERETFNTTEDLLCYIGMTKYSCKIFSSQARPEAKNMDFSVFYELKNGNFICEGIWNPLYYASEYLHYNKELERLEFFKNGILEYQKIITKEMIVNYGFVFQNNRWEKRTKITTEKTYYIN